MPHQIRAIVHGAGHLLLAADMPFDSYHVAIPQLKTPSARSGTNPRGDPTAKLKLDDGLEIVSTVRRISRVGVPAMAHVGLMPQHHPASSGYSVQGRDAARAQAVLGG